MTPITQGIAIRDAFVPAEAFTPTELENAMYRLSADPDQAALLLESCDLTEADAVMNPGVDLIAEAVTAVKNRLDRMMTALIRVFSRHSSEVEPLDKPNIGPDRKNALFAYKTVTFTFSDGQTVSILFHSPGSDPMKLHSNDTLIAYRWMLNRRDITAIVSPEKGRDITLQTMARRIMQLVEENSEKFKANNEKRQEQKEKLAALESEQGEVSQRVESLTQENASLSGDIESADDRIARLRERLASMGEDEREGSGAGTGSTDTPEGNGDDAGDTGLTGHDEGALFGAESLRVKKLSPSRTGGKGAHGHVVVARQKDGSEVEIGEPFMGKGRGAAAMTQEKAEARLTELRTLQTQLRERRPGATVAESQQNVTANAPSQDAGTAAIRAAAQAMGWQPIGNAQQGNVMYGPDDRATAVYGGASEDGSINVQVFSEFFDQKTAFADALRKALKGGNSGDESGDQTSARVNDYLARIEAAETAQEVGAIANEFEHDTDIQGDDFTRVNNAIRERRTAIAKAASQAKIDSPEMAETVERFMAALRESTELRARIRRDVPGRDESELTPDAFRGYAKNWFERNEEEVLGELGTTIPPRPEILDQFADQAAPYIAELAQEFAASGSDGEPGSLKSLDSRLYRDIAGSIGMIRSIDLGEEKGMNRSAFTNSIAGKLKTQARNGNDDVVDAALLLLAEQGVEHGRAILAPRNRVWSITGQDADYYKGIAQRRSNASSEPDEPAATPDEDESETMPDDPTSPTEAGNSDSSDDGAGERSEMQQVEAGLQALIDNETDATRFDEQLDEWAERAEAGGLMDALDAKLNEAADKLTDLLNAEAANVA